MSRATVRRALAAFLGGTETAVPGIWQGNTPTPLLGTVFSTPPREEDLHDDHYVAAQAVGATSGAVAIVRVLTEVEQRMASPYVSGIKRKGYQVAVDVYVLSKAATTEAAMGDADTVWDAVVDRLRSDPTLGGAVFSAGEGDASSSAGQAGSLRWSFDTPGIDEATAAVGLHGRLEFAVVEHITG